MVLALFLLSSNNTYKIKKTRSSRVSFFIYAVIEMGFIFRL
ncbi:hypothetical protein CHCC20375_3315 [Bacillus licheniformis]|nr:hypothetical protein CHCC20375_3315 [Bacillus licheniformis]